MGDYITADWGLAPQAQPNDVFNAFMAGQKLARDARVTKQADDARQAALANPNDPNAVNAFATYDPQGAAALRANITNQAFAPALAEQLGSRPQVSSYAAPQPNAMMPAPQAPAASPYDAQDPAVRRALQNGQPLPSIASSFPQAGQQAPGQPQAAPQQAQPSFDQAFGPATQQALQTPGAPLPQLPQGAAPQAPQQGMQQAPGQQQQPGQAPQVDLQTLLSPAAPHMQALGAAAMQGQISSPNAALIALAKVGGPEAVQSLVTSVGQMDVQRRANLQDANDAMGSAAQQLLGAPQSQRAQLLQQMAPQLAQHGVTIDQINQEIAVGGLTDQQLQGFVGQSLGVKGVIDAADKQRELSQSQQRIGIDQYNAQSQRITATADAQGTGINDGYGNIVNNRTGAIMSSQGGSGGGTGGTITSGSGKAWSPVGSGNSSLAVANKTAAIAQAAGVSPTTPLTRDQFLSLDMTKNEGPFKGQNNPGNIMNADGKTPVNYSSPAAYQAAQQSWLGRRWDEGYRTVADAVAGKGAAFGGGAGGSVGGGGLNADTVKQDAASALASGSLVPLPGQARNKAAYTIINNEMTRQMQVQGLTAQDVLAGKAALRADTSSLGKLEGQATIVRAAEGAARRNADLALSLAPAVGNGNIQVFNAWKNHWATSMGDPQVSGFATAMDTFANEYAKVMGGGVSSDTLRAEGHTLLNTAQSPQQLQAVVGTMKKDMANRSAAYQDERSSTLGRISGNGPVRVNGPEDVARLASGTEFITPEGRPMRKR